MEGAVVIECFEILFACSIWESFIVFLNMVIITDYKNNSIITLLAGRMTFSIYFCKRLAAILFSNGYFLQFLSLFSQM